MTKEQFGKRLSEKTGMPYAECYAFLKIVVQEMREVLLEGDEITMEHFGRLTLRRKLPKYNGMYKKYSKDHFVPFLKPSVTMLRDLEKLDPKDFQITNIGFMRRFQRETALEKYIKKKNGSKKKT